MSTSGWTRTRFVAGVAMLVALAVPLAAQEKAPLTAPDYARWESFGTVLLSGDGAWLAYEVRRVNEENELRIQGPGEDSVRVVPYGSGAVFSDHARWLAYRIGLSAAQEKKKEAKVRVGLLDLRGVRDLGSGAEVPLGNVDAYLWSPSGHVLAATLKTVSGSGNAVQVFDPLAGTLRVLDRSDASYSGLTWRDDADDLAVLRARKDEGFEDETHVVLMWRDVSRGTSAARTMDPATAPGFPEGMGVADFRALTWSDDGRTVFVGVRPRDPAPEPADSAEADADKDDADKDDDTPSEVQVWNAKDERIIPMQRAQEERDLHRTLLAAWHVDDGSFVTLGSDLMASAATLAGGAMAYEEVTAPYAVDGMFGRSWEDVYLVDASSGERTRILEKVRHVSGGSPEGRYLLYFRGDDWWAYDVQSRREANLTDGLDGDFADRSYDYPVVQLPPVGFRPVGWVDGDAAVLLRDRLDVWAVSPDGAAGRRLTDGRAEDVEHWAVTLDPDQESFDSEKPLYLSLFGNKSKKSGYGRVALRKAGATFQPRSAVERLVFEDASVGRLMKASNAERYGFVRERFDDSPDVFLGGAGLADAQQITTTNPFQADYAWGHAETVDFTSRAGVALQATLLYPAGYEPGRKYPMIVYTYELLSDGVHRYVVPSERSYYNFQAWTQQGYFVLQPDIVYRPRDPGISAVDAVVPAVEKIVGMGLVDAGRVGLIGHSWGGYQATFIPTQTDIFATSVAGAPITDFLSMAGAVHWRPGLPEFGHWETGQARMDVPPWEDFEAHVRNSPAAHIQTLHTPMLMMQGDDDGTVDFRQGVEFYNYARRAGKEFVFLVYPGADHGLRQKQDQVDYHRRILEWFAHYLKGEPAPPWITQAVSWLDQQKGRTP